VRLAHLLDSQHLNTAPGTAALTTPDAWTPHAPTPPAEQASIDEAFNAVLGRILPCRNEDPELWFAEQAALVEQAKALCRACPLMAGCLDGALERAEPWGVWGGEVFVDGAIVATKRGRGRPRKDEITIAA